MTGLPEDKFSVSKDSSSDASQGHCASHAQRPSVATHAAAEAPAELPEEAKLFPGTSLLPDSPGPKGGRDLYRYIVDELPWQRVAIWAVVAWVAYQLHDFFGVRFILLYATLWASDTSLPRLCLRPSASRSPSSAAEATTASCTCTATCRTLLWPFEQVPAAACTAYLILQGKCLVHPAA